MSSISARLTPAMTATLRGSASSGAAPGTSVPSVTSGTAGMSATSGPSGTPGTSGTSGRSGPSGSAEPAGRKPGPVRPLGPVTGGGEDDMSADRSSAGLVRMGASPGRPSGPAPFPFVVMVIQTARSVGEVGKGFQRDLQPGWPVPGFVHHFVHRFVQLKGAQQHLVGHRVGPARPGVTGAERGTVAPDPLPGHSVQPFRVRVVEQLEAGRVVERAEHPGHVPHGGGAGPPLGQRAGRFTLEVEDDPARL